MTPELRRIILTLTKVGGPFHYRQQFVAITNLSFGLIEWEADLRVITKSGWLHEVFDPLNHEFGPFELDAAASIQNTKCDNFWDLGSDALSKSWGGFSSVWCNPPYSNIAAWVAKALHETEVGGGLPSRRNAPSGQPDGAEVVAGSHRAVSRESPNPDPLSSRASALRLAYRKASPEKGRSAALRARRRSHRKNFLRRKIWTCCF